MPEIRTFQAENLQDALHRVRREMGADAVILNTRELPPRKRMLGLLKARPAYEVTAGIGISTRAATRRAAPRPQPARRPVQAPPMTPQEDRAAEIVRNLVRNKGGAAFSSDGVEVALSHRSAAPEPAARPAVVAERQPAGEDPTQRLATRLDAIQRALERLERERGDSSATACRFDPEQQAVYDELIAGEVAPEEAARLVTTSRGGRAPTVREAVRTTIEASIRCSGPIQATPRGRRVVALVGPTGVGKTTTIAKLAANFRVREGLSVGLVTVDTFRIAAVEQLRTYAEIIDLPMKVVTNAGEMGRALDELTGLDVVLIDTAGRSPHAGEQIAELQALLEAAAVDEVHLVVSLAASRRALATAVERFAPAGVTALIATKLDEAESVGSLLSLARHSSLPLSYFTTGQDVPDDIEPARSSAAAELLLPRRAAQAPAAFSTQNSPQDHGIHAESV